MSNEILAPTPVADHRDGTTGRFTDGHRGPGRPKGSLNKTTAEIRQMVVEALDGAGGVDYLIMQAYANPAVFCGLVGKVLPIQVDAEVKNVQMVYVRHEFDDTPPPRKK